MYSKNRLKRFVIAAMVISPLIYMGVQVHLYHMTAVEGWDSSANRDVSRYILPNVSTTLLRPDHICESPALLMIIVCSAPYNFEARFAIRESWGSKVRDPDSISKLYFLVGQTLDDTVQKYLGHESKQYGDIIQERFLDSYNNLTLKSMMLLKLVRNECKHMVSFVMKTDDDMFINIENLVRTVKTMNTSKILFGSLMCHVKPVKDFYDKWYVPKYMYSAEIYPNYLSGTGYVMSADVAETLFNTALSTPLIHLEDVYLTGICAKQSHIKPFHNGNFYFYKIPFNPCDFKNLITAHRYTPIELRHLYYRVHSYNLEEECKLYKKSIQNMTTPKSVKKKNMCV